VLRDPLLRLPARISERIDETPTRSPSTSNCSTRANAKPSAIWPGQFGEISAFGEGESTLSLPANSGQARAADRHHQAGGRPHRSATPSLRGRHNRVPRPYGKAFPVADWKGKDIVIAGGGIGLAPLKPSSVTCSISAPTTAS